MAELQRRGIDVAVEPLLEGEPLARRMVGGRYGALDTAHAWLKRFRSMLRARRYDVIWVEKEFLPWLPGLVERIPGLLRVPYVVEYDDATFHTYDHHRSHLVRLILGRKIATVMRHAAVVVVGNSYLGEYARAAGARNVVEIPTVVDTHRFTPASRPRHGAPFRIGWIGTPSTAPYLKEIAEPLRTFTRTWPAQLVTVGAPSAPFGGVPLEMHSWDEAGEVEAIQSLDVGIMPMPDSLWTRGKCGYKLIQYMACGLPTVAAPIGVNASIVEDGVTGFLAKTGDEWVRSLEILYKNAELRANLGRAGRAKVTRHYSLEVAVPVLASALRQAAANHDQFDSQATQ
jgi:glycosyltransferase involved in cell wall biosynthesis